MFLVTECHDQNHWTLSSANRKNTYHRSVGIHLSECDNSIGPAWYRFEGEAGTQMATDCPAASVNYGVISRGWLKDEHPTITDRQAAKTVCFRYFNKCCRFHTTIKVTNCGFYYVYYLHLNRNNSFGCIRFSGSD